MVWLSVCLAQVNKPITQQSFKAMLNSFGITLPDSLKPKIKNVAAVAVHAELPAFENPVKPLISRCRLSVVRVFTWRYLITNLPKRG